MTERLSLTQALVLSGYVLVLAAGQMLFKLAAQRSIVDAPLAERLLGLVQDWTFLLALAIYVGLAVAWVWILTFTPLSRAYPFVALVFAITPLVGAWLFAEPVSLRLLIGIGVILVGVVLVSG